MPASGSVTAIITAFQCAKYLPEAIESVLAQSRRIDEVVVVDDGSTDDCEAVVASFGSRVRSIRQPNGGIGCARNRGLGEAEGEWIAFLDGDDVWEADKTEVQFRAAAENPAADLIFGVARNFISPDVDPSLAAGWRAVEGPIAGMVVGAMLGRRSAMDRVGGFRTDLRLGEFIDWLARARDLGLGELIIPDLVLHRRIHGANHTLREQGRRSDYVRVLKASLDRRRAGA